MQVSAAPVATRCQHPRSKGCEVTQYRTLQLDRKARCSNENGGIRINMRAAFGAIEFHNNRQYNFTTQTPSRSVKELHRPVAVSPLPSIDACGPKDARTWPVAYQLRSQTRPCATSSKTNRRTEGARFAFHTESMRYCLPKT